MLRLAILNGPNLNLIGSREQHIYGSQPLDNYLEDLKAKYTNVEFNFYQSNAEGEMINFLHDCRGNLVRSDGKRVALIGMENVAVIVDGDDILVMPLARSQDVRIAAQARDPPVD